MAQSRLWFKNKEEARRLFCWHFLETMDNKFTGKNSESFLRKVLFHGLPGSLSCILGAAISFIPVVGIAAASPVSKGVNDVTKDELKKYVSRSDEKKSEGNQQNVELRAGVSGSNNNDFKIGSEREEKLKLFLLQLALDIFYTYEWQLYFLWKKSQEMIKEISVFSATRCFEIMKEDNENDNGNPSQSQEKTTPTKINPDKYHQKILESLSTPTEAFLGKLENKLSKLSNVSPTFMDLSDRDKNSKGYQLFLAGFFCAPIPAFQTSDGKPPDVFNCERKSVGPRETGAVQNISNFTICYQPPKDLKKGLSAGLKMECLRRPFKHEVVQLNDSIRSQLKLKLKVDDLSTQQNFDNTACDFYYQDQNYLLSSMYEKLLSHFDAKILTPLIYNYAKRIAPMVENIQSTIDTQVVPKLNFIEEHVLGIAKLLQEVQIEKEFPKWSTSVSAEGRYTTRRGCVLFINNTFQGLDNPAPEIERLERHGAEFDTEHVRNCFGDTLNYDVTICENVSSMDWLKVLKDFQGKCEKMKTSFCIVIVSSHGAGPDSSAMLVDNVLVNLYENLIYLFGDQGFPFMAGKPKLFFFNGCRVSGHHENKFDVDSIGEYDFRGHYYLYKDILIGCSALPFQNSYRSIKDGSMYIKALTDTVQELHESQHVTAILNQVADRMAQLFPQMATLPQTPSYTSVNFHKQFYF